MVATVAKKNKQKKTAGGHFDSGYYHKAALQKPINLRNKSFILNFSLITKLEVMVMRKNSLRQCEEETSRETRFKREPMLI